MDGALRHGPLSERTAHLVIDMQNLFAAGAPWQVPWMDRVLSVVAEIAEMIDIFVGDRGDGVLYGA